MTQDMSVIDPTPTTVNQTTNGFFHEWRFPNPHDPFGVGIRQRPKQHGVLITCANIANLFLASGANRRKEMAVRAALGANRGRLVAQLLTESLALCVMGGVGGIAVASLLMRVASPFLPPDLPSYAELSLNTRALVFASAVALGVALLVGIFPALRTSSGALTPAMNAGARGSSAVHERVRRLIVIGEVATSIVLICAALLLARSLTKLQRVDLGAQRSSAWRMLSAEP